MIGRPPPLSMPIPMCSSKRARRTAMLPAALSAIVSLASASVTIAQVQQQDASTIDVSALQWRSIGPYQIGGRITSLAVPRITSPNAPRPGVVFYAASLGGLYRTSNEGSSWSSLFDREGSAAVHTVEVSPANPNVVWAGTGDFMFV